MVTDVLRTPHVCAFPLFCFSRCADVSRTNTRWLSTNVQRRYVTMNITTTIILRTDRHERKESERAVLLCAADITHSCTHSARLAHTRILIIIVMVSLRIGAQAHDRRGKIMRVMTREGGLSSFRRTRAHRIVSMRVCIVTIFTISFITHAR